MPKTLRVHIPLELRRRGGRPRILPPKHVEAAMGRGQDPHMLRAIAGHGYGGSGWNAARSPRSLISPPMRASPTATSAASCASHAWRPRCSNHLSSTASPARSASTTCASWRPCRGKSSR